MNKNKKVDIKDTIKYVNPVSLGILYFGFASSLWASEQISNHQVLAIAILLTIVSFAFFVAVFSERVLKLMNKIVKVLAPLTFLAFVFAFTIGWLQAFLQVSGIALQVIAYFGFAWIIVILLTLIRDAVKQERIKRLITFLIVVAFPIIAVIKFLNHDFWSGVYLIVIAGLALSIAKGWLKVNGRIFEQHGLG